MRDYGESGVSIQEAFVLEATSLSAQRQVPPEILWNGLRIRTAERVAVPNIGRVRAEFLSLKPGYQQAFDLKLKGSLLLSDGTRLGQLRSWYDPRLEPTVEYRFESEDGFLWVSTASRYARPNGEIVEERWTGNSGMLVERLEDSQFVFHCSAANSDPADFETFVFRVEILAGWGPH